MGLGEFFLGGVSSGPLPLVPLRGFPGFGSLYLGCTRRWPSRWRGSGTPAGDPSLSLLARKGTELAIP